MTVAPAKTDPAIVKKLLDQINVAVRSSEVRSQLVGKKASPRTAATSQEFAALLKREGDTRSKTVKIAQITAN